MGKTLVLTGGIDRSWERMPSWSFGGQRGSILRKVLYGSEPKKRQMEKTDFMTKWVDLMRESMIGSGWEEEEDMAAEEWRRR